jgi:uncharacterized protein YndB with AHSA1/START domain
MDIVQRVGILAPVSKVYTALSTIEGLAGWWTTSTTGRAEQGGEIVFRFQDGTGKEIGGFDMDVLEASADQRVRWRVKAGPEEWVGTEIAFDLSRQDDFTIVRFAHRGWPEESEFLAHCTTKWATFLLSLRSFVETGVGRPAPGDLRIGDWH